MSVAQSVISETIIALVGLDVSAEQSFADVIDQSKVYERRSYPKLSDLRRAIDSGELASATILVTESRLLRQRRSFPSFVRVIALSGPDVDSLQPVEADDIIRRPLDDREIRVRLRSAARELHSQEVQFTDLLKRTLESGKSGELIISNSDDSARIHVAAGKVAWIHSAKKPISVVAVVAECGIELDNQSARDVIEECRSSHRYFGDVLVEWGIVDADRFKECLKGLLEQELREVARWPHATSTFVSDIRPRSSSMAFGLGEIALPPRPSVRILTTPGMAATRPEENVDPELIKAWLDRFEKTMSLGCVLLDAKGGGLLGSRNFPVSDQRTAWELAAAYAALGPDREELLAVTGHSAFLVRSAGPSLAATVVLRFKPKEVSPAMVRIQLAGFTET